MKKSTSSFTAEGIAWVRALETRRSPNERICNDPYAEKFFGGVISFFDKLLSLLTGIFGIEWVYGRFEKKGPGVMGFLVVRARYIDDYLQSCIENGIEQLIILGAGFDSRAYRFEGLKGRVKIFEVDHPATQATKKERLQKIFGALPNYVTYVSVDFNEQALDIRLYESGYSKELKTLFIWEGVTTYLEPEAVDGTLSFIANQSGKGSSVIFDYVYTCALDGSCERQEISKMRKYKGIYGEVPVFGLDPDKVETFLVQRGFYNITNVTAEDLENMYFTGANAGRTVAPVYGIVTASVK